MTGPDLHDHPTVADWSDLVRRTAVLVPRAAEVSPRLALGATLRDDVVSPRDLPAVPLSAMDGFAVHLADLEAATGPAGQTAVTLPVVADIPASRGGVAPLAPGSAARIMTGAPVPEGADVVVEVESTDADPHAEAPTTVTIAAGDGLRPGRHIRRPGEEVAAGTVLARPGDRVGPALVALAATLGIPALPVAEPPHVTVLVTGDELVAPDDPEADAPGAVRESNGAMLAAALTLLGAGVDVIRCPDDVAALTAELDAAAARSDLVLTSGGIGHGAYDVVKAALGPTGRGSSTFAHLRLRPGGPQGVGRVRVDGPDGQEAWTPVVHLPGTPVGALVGFHLFVRPLLAPGAAARPVRALVGRAPEPRPGPERPRAAARRPGMFVLPGRLGRADDGSLVVDVLDGRRLAPYGRADALVLADDAMPAPGQGVPVLPL